MDILVLLLLPPLIGLALIIVIAIWGTNALAHRLIGRKHQWMEEILATGDAPLSWRREMAEKLARQRHHTNHADALHHLQHRLQQRYLRQFDGLIHYARTTALVADEETRHTLLSQLQAARAAWSIQSLDPLEKPKELAQANPYSLDL
jgi:hypothetical protein